MNEIVLHVICPDKKGVIAQFTKILFDNQSNILMLEQHVDSEDGYFLMRIHAEVKLINNSYSHIKKKLDELTENLNGVLKIFDLKKEINIAILCTKESQPVVDILLKQRSGELGVNIPIVISNHNNLKDLAESFGVKYIFCPIDDRNKEEQEKFVLKELKKYNIHLVVLARYMQILSSSFLKNCNAEIINIHHGFLPAFKGGNPYRQAWEKGVKMIGATAHYVTEELDAGPIISQDTESVTHQFSVKKMAESGRDIERRVLFSAVKAHVEYRILLHGKRTIIFHG